MAVANSTLEIEIPAGSALRPPPPPIHTDTLFRVPEERVSLFPPLPSVHVDTLFHVPEESKQESAVSPAAAPTSMTDALSDKETARIELRTKWHGMLLDLFKEHQEALTICDDVSSPQTLHPIVLERKKRFASAMAGVVESKLGCLFSLASDNYLTELRWMNEFVSANKNVLWVEELVLLDKYRERLVQKIFEEGQTEEGPEPQPPPRKRRRKAR